MMGLSKVKIVKNEPKGNNYSHCANTIIRCFGKIILSKDDFAFLFVEIDFSGYHNMYVRLWPEVHVSRHLPFQNSDDSAVDCCP